MTRLSSAFDSRAIDEPEISARRIIEEASGWDGAELAPHLDDPPTEATMAHLDHMVARRLSGEPVQYVVGRWDFRSLDLMVDHRVLIPRPETEEVAGLAIDEARRFTAAGIAPTVVDLGTGSGAIGLSVAVEVPEAQVHMTDASTDAAAVARANLTGIGGSADARVDLGRVVVRGAPPLPGGNAARGGVEPTVCSRR